MASITYHIISYHTHLIFSLTDSYFITELDSSNIDAYYLLACCLSVSNEYEQALATLSALFGISDDAQLEHILRLNAFLCTRTVPPQFDEAILTYNILVQKFPEHMDSVRTVLTVYNRMIVIMMAIMIVVTNVVLTV